MLSVAGANEWKEKFVDGGDKSGIMNMSEKISDEMKEKLRESGVLVTSEKDLKQGLEEFKKHVENMQEPYKSVFQYYAEHTSVISNPLQMSSIGYDPKEDAITCNAKFFRLAHHQQHSNVIFSHEFAHRFDVLNVQSWANNDFTNTIHEATRKITENLSKYNEMYKAVGNVNPAVQDILGALSDNKIKVQYSHSKWDHQTVSAEIFANLTYLRSNAVDIPSFDGLLDDIVDVFEKMFMEGV